MQGAAKCITMTKGGLTIKFDIVIPTKNGALYCACLKRKQDDVHGGILGEGTEMNVAKAHALLGHCNELSTRRTASYLDWKITQGALKTCESCAIGKARQKNVPKQSSGEKAKEPNGRWFHDIATIKSEKEVAFG